MQNNEYLIPVLIVDLCHKYKDATNTNEQDNLKLRLEATRNYIDAYLNKPSGSMIFKVDKGTNMFPSRRARK